MQKQNTAPPLNDVSRHQMPGAGRKGLDLTLTRLGPFYLANLWCRISQLQPEKPRQQRQRL
jgi:hypothetical protein